MGSYLTAAGVLSGRVRVVASGRVYSLRSLVKGSDSMCCSFLKSYSGVMGFGFTPGDPFVTLSPVVPGGPGCFCMGGSCPCPFV